MSFEHILREIVSGCDALGAALMGSDGIPIAQEVARGGGEDASDALGVLGVEFGRLLDETRKAADSVDGGSVDELTTRMGRYAVVARSVDDETFLVVALAPEGNLGKARFLARRHLPALREQL
jgi:predicted regulator of Ras-like GTPase activity (Roadblock/LC7/MglB family)